MNRNRILAVDVVRLQAPPERMDDVRWFYTEVAGLEDVTDEQGDPEVLRFRSGRIHLCVTLTESPAIEEAAYHVTIAVASLRKTRTLLDERRIPYQTMRGLAWTDRRVGVQDPAGNRVYLKQDWPDYAI